MKCLERDPGAQAWRNTDPTELLKEINEASFGQRDWTTYSFANRRLWDNDRERLLSDDEVIAKMMVFYQQLAKKSKASIQPKLFVSHWDKSLHFHAIELSTGITRRQRVECFRKVFQRFHQWPKDLYNSVIHSERWDPSKGALFYASGGHNEVFTKPFGPKRKTTDDNKKKIQEWETMDPYMVQLLAVLNS